MKLHELSPVPGSNPKAYRKGRGNGSGNGKTAPATCWKRVSCPSVSTA